LDKLNKHFKLFANCIPCKGATRSTIIDLQRNKLIFIPNGLYDILQIKNKTIKEIQLMFNKKHEKIIIDYFKYLVEEELGFYCEKEELDLFPELNLLWEEPSQITNAIIHVDKGTKHGYKEIFKQLDKLNCKNIQIVFFRNYKTSELIEILELIENSRIIAIDFIIKEQSEDVSILKDIVYKYPRVCNIYIYATNISKVEKVRTKTMGNIIWVNDSISSIEDCGKINSQYFTINIKMFTESQCHNTCLNRKISIDADGYIKNCPSMKHHYGHICKTSLEEAIEKNGFKDWWFIKKDDIDVCQDCEFRHICTDCRAFIKDFTNIYSQPAKCGYNPYIASWKDEENWINIEQWRKENQGWVEETKINRVSDNKETCINY